MNSLGIKIRSIKKTEVSKLQKISQSTFYETFVNDCTPSDMERFLDNDFGLEKLTLELENSESDFFFVESEDQIIGYLKLNRGAAQTESKLKNSLEIERFYVIPAFHGKKIAQQMMNKALEIAKSGHFDWIWLGVWENNARAIRFYEKHGFEKFDKHIFMVGTDAQTDVLMKKELKK
jgi:ribosomal protein S18 acetylase RimI-like enzyme